MATLENIRKRGPLVALIIGLALFAFILGDLFRSGSSLFGGDRYEIAKVNGKSFNYQDYENKVQETIEMYKNRGISLSDNDRDQIREMVWNNMIQTLLLEGEYTADGISISSEELFDLMQGKNVDPMVAQDPAFRNQQTGMFDPSRVVFYYKNMNEDKSGQTKAYLLNLEKQVTDNRLARKYLALVEKGLYIPMPQVETEFKQRGYMVDIDYVGKLYNEIQDSSVTISPADLKKYYNEHKNEYEQKASRDIVYVTFDVFPSKKDSMNTLNWINKIVDEFKQTSDNQQFINFNSDVKFEPSHLKKGEISNAEIDSFLFSAQVGDVYGPYFEAGSYKLAKLIKTDNLPDSIKAKHILIAINNTNIPDKTKAKLVADSLKAVIEGGVDFATVAKEYSADTQTMEEGGDLGWLTEGQTATNQIPVKPFDELVNKNLNEIVEIEEDYGVHLMVKTDQSEQFNKVMAGFLERKIVASSETYQKTYADASKFAGENRKLSKFDESVTAQNLIKKSAPGLTENGTFIPGLESPRPLIRWAYNAKIGDVSEVFELGKRYVIGALVDIKKEGIAAFEQVGNQIRFAVLKEKKAEVLVKQIKEASSSDISTMAQKLQVEVKEAKNISFNIFQIPGMGFEPRVIAYAVTSEKGKVTEPIKGENGVYAINVKIVTPALSTENVDLSIDRNRMYQSLQNRIYPNPQYGGTGEVLRALKEAAEIKDERSKFY